MKRIFTALALLPLLFSNQQLAAQYCGGSGPSVCTPTSGITVAGFYPPQDSLPCAVDGQLYTQIVDFHTPDSASGYPIVSIAIDSITNLPCGLCWSMNVSNNTVPGNATACIKVTGTTYDAPGQYLLKVYADVTVLISGFFHYTVPNVYIDSVAGLKYYVRVRIPGDTCGRIDTASKGLTASRHGAITTPTISGSTAICPGGTTTLTAGGANYYGYAWSNGTFSPSITVSTAGTYTVTVYENCSSATASKIVTNATVTTPVITSTGPTTFCQGAKDTLKCSSASSYLWSNNATTQNITVSQAGSYTVTTTNASNCTASSAPTVIIVNALPNDTITPGGPTTFCAGGSVQLNAAAGLTYHWGNNTTGQSITVTTSGSYTVTVSNTNCSAVSAPVVVTVNPLPNDTITPGGPTTFCTGGNVTLTAAPGLTYHWSNSSANRSIVVTAAGSYSVTVSNANCSAVSAPTVVTVNSLPNDTVTANGPLTFCAGGSVTLTAPAGLSYLWSTNGTGQTITVTASGSYKVTVTNGNNCSAVSSATVVTVNPAPVNTITPSGPASFCLGGSVSLSAVAGYAYLWSNTSTNQSITVGVAGTYSVTVTNVNTSCSAVSTPTVVVVFALPNDTVTVGGPTTFCAGGSVTLTAPPGLTYNWSNSVSTQGITVGAAGSYTVTVTNGNHCSAVSAPVVVNLYPAPDTAVTANGPTAFCIGDSVTLSAAAGLSYHWSNATIGQSITVNSANSYTVTVSNANNCSAVSAPVQVTVNANPNVQITPNGPTAFCSGGRVSLTATSGLSSYLWSDSLTTRSINATAGGTYTVTGTDANGCSAASSGILITIKPATGISVQPVAQATCIGGNVTFSVTASGSNLGYQWQLNNANIGGATASLYNIPAAAFSDTGSYRVIVTGDCGKDTSLSEKLTVTGSLTFSQQPASQAICLGNPVTFTVVANGGNASFQWKKNNVNINGARSSTYAISNVASTDTGSYTCFVSSTCGNGTSNAATLTVKAPTSYSFGKTICANSSYNFNGRNLRAGGVYIDTLTGSNGCDSIVTLNLTVKQLSFTALNDTICANGSFTFNGRVLTSTGTYTDTLTAANGCDSIVTLNLTVKQLTSSTINTAICANSSYTFNGQIITAAGTYTDTLTGINGCDSMVTLNLTVKSLSAGSVSASICDGNSYFFNGQNLTTSGTYTDTLTGANGCDSIVTLSLTVNPPLTGTVSAIICTGGSYFFNGQNLSMPGYYSDTLLTGSGCDSIVTLHLTVAPPASTVTQAGICMGSSYPFKGQNLTSTGTYYDTLVVAGGCDSIVILHLTVNPPLTATVNASICAGGSYLFNGHGLTAAGTYSDTLFTAGGCDSIVTLQLSVNPPLTGDANVSICAGSSYTFNGRNLTVAGTYSDTVITGGGCDSIVTLHLTVNPPLTGTVNANICVGGTYSFNGRSLGLAGTYADTVTTTGGCDSIITLQLSVNPPLTDSITATICSGGSYSFGSQNLTAGGVYNDTLFTAGGCDSIVTLQLTVNPRYSDTINVAICTGGSYSFNGQSISIAGTYYDSLHTVSGCDSVIVLQLSVSSVIRQNTSAFICQGTSYSFFGRNLSAAGTYTDTTIALGGCDSIVTLHLYVNQPVYSTVNAVICQGSNYNFNGRIITAVGTYYDTLTAVIGCDSIVTLNLVARQPDTTAIQATICNGNSYNLNGRQLYNTGIYVDTLTNVTGCDSFVVLYLQVSLVINVINQAQICSGQTYSFNGRNLRATGIYNDTLTAQGGCDSIATLALTVIPAPVSTISASICTGSTYFFNGKTYSVAGTYTDTLTGPNGCDSMATLRLSLLPLPVVSWTGGDTLCTDGVHPITIHGGTPAGGTYSGTGVTGNVLNATGSGIYVITYAVVDSNGCRDSLNRTFVVENCTGIDEQSLANSISIYPNPAGDILVAESDLFVNGPVTPLLFDVTGKLITVRFTLESNKLVLNTTALASGMYWLKFSIQGTLVSKRFVKVD